MNEEQWLVPVIRYMSTGLAVTLWIAFLTVVFATLVGIFIGIGAISHRRWVRRLVAVYVDFFRGIPSLLILLFVFFALPQIGIGTDPTTSAVIGLSLWGSANIAETARGALQSISPNQNEAAAALGINTTQTLAFVILPQALRRFLPSYVGQLTVLIQATALTSIVGVTDIQGTARQND